MAQGDVKGYWKPVYIHGDGCTIRSDGINHFALHGFWFYFWAKSDERALSIDEVNECLPPNKEFTVSYEDTSVPADNLELAEEFIGELMHCAEELFYLEDRNVSFGRVSSLQLTCSCIRFWVPNLHALL